MFSKCFQHDAIIFQVEFRDIQYTAMYTSQSFLYDTTRHSHGKEAHFTADVKHAVHKSNPNPNNLTWNPRITFQISKALSSNERNLEEDSYGYRVKKKQYRGNPKAIFITFSFFDSDFERLCDTNYIDGFGLGTSTIHYHLNVTQASTREIIHQHQPIPIIMIQVAQLQNLTRCLLAAGYSKSRDGREQHLLYVDAQTSLLQFQQWSGDSIVKDELVGSAVRPNSTAAHLITPTGKFIICITPSSTLSTYTYDDEEREWVQNENDPLSTYVVHRDGKLAASVDANGRVHAVFQDASQRLAYLDSRWSDTVLPVRPSIGSPISILVVGNTLHVYYISAKDECIHDVSRMNDIWNDMVLTKHSFDKKIQSFVVVESESGDNEVYVRSEDDALLKINALGRLMRLGTVQKGKFISERSVDGCTNDAWNGALTEDRLKNYLADDPSCIDTPGGDQSVTPLAAACMTGRLDVVQLLLHHRANPNALSPKRRTPLFYATSTRKERDRLAITRALLKAGANVDECYAESGFNTPLMNAITLISDEDIANELLNHGASPIANDLTGQTVEMLAKGTPMEKMLSRRVREINKLLTSGGSSNTKSLTGQAVKTLAKGIPMKKMLSRQVEQAKELLNRGASSTAKGFTGQTVEILAQGMPKNMLSKRVEKTNELLSRDTSSSGSDLTDQTVKRLAQGVPMKRVSLRPAERASKLPNHDASPTAEDSTGQTVEMLTEKEKMENIMLEPVEQAESSEFEEQIIEFIVALLMFIITYTSIPGVKDFMDQITRKLNHIDDDEMYLLSIPSYLTALGVAELERPGRLRAH